jgi:hypothetical protein
MSGDVLFLLGAEYPDTPAIEASTTVATVLNVAVRKFFLTDCPPDDGPWVWTPQACVCLQAFDRRRMTGTLGDR